MRICLVSGVQLWPPESGGQLRTSALAEALAKHGYDVHVHSLTGRRHDYLARTPSAEYRRGPRLTEYVDRSWRNAALQFLTYRFHLPDLWHLMTTSNLPPADVIIADFPFLARYLERSQSSLRVLNCHNLEHERWRRPWTKIVHAVEKRAARTADIVLVTTEREAVFYRAQGTDAVIVPNALPARRFTGHADRRTTRRELGLSDDETVVLFTGSRYEPNRLGVETLRRAGSPGVTFLVVGSVASRPERRPGWLVTGPVPMTEKYFAAADWAINPVTTGSGTNVKMAEYVMARLPILATPFGTRGFHLDAGADYLPFDGQTLDDVLERARRMPAEARRQMADRAYEKNLSLVDMEALVAERVVPRLQ